MAEHRPWLDTVTAIKEKLGKKGWPLLEATLWCVVRSASFDACVAALNEGGEELPSSVGSLLSAAIDEKAEALMSDKAETERMKRIIRDIKKHACGMEALRILTAVRSSAVPNADEVVGRLPAVEPKAAVDLPTTVEEYLETYKARNKATVLTHVDFLLLAYKKGPATMRCAERDARRAKEWLELLAPTDEAYKQMVKHEDGGDHVKQRALQVRASLPTPP